MINFTLDLYKAVLKTIEFPTIRIVIWSNVLFLLTNKCFTCNRNGMTTIWGGTTATMGVSRTYVSLPTSCGSRMCSCTIGEDERVQLGKWVHRGRGINEKVVWIENHAPFTFVLSCVVFWNFYRKDRLPLYLENGMVM